MRTVDLNESGLQLSGGMQGPAAPNTHSAKEARKEWPGCFNSFKNDVIVQSDWIVDALPSRTGPASSLRNASSL